MHEWVVHSRESFPAPKFKAKDSTQAVPAADTMTTASILRTTTVELDFKNRQNKRNLALRDKFLVTNYTFMY